MADIVKDNYDASSISLLDGLVAVRKRPAMYIGSTNSFGLHHLIWEIVDNAVDEAINGFGSTISVTIHKDGSVSVLDEGRGIPVDMHPTAHIPAIQLIFTTLHSGGKFNSKSYQTSAGLHGVGTAVTNALSEWCDVTVYKSGKINHIRFENGGRDITVPLEVLGNTKKHGTLVTFKPDPTVFSTTNFNFDTVSLALQERAFLLTKVRFIFNDERSGMEREYYYENGLSEYVSNLNVNKKPLSNIITFNDTIDSIQIDIAFQYCSEDYNESIYSYANNVRTRDGGSHESGFKAGITKAVNDYAEEHNLLRKGKLDGTDIREGITAVISLKLPEGKLQYEGQTKQRLGTADAYTAVFNLVSQKMTYYLNENKEFAVTLIKKCTDAQYARLEARKAKEAARGTKKIKNDLVLSDKLTPAQSKEYDKNELFIVEGESAGGSARKGRDRIHQAILPLRGKPLNTDTVTMERMLKNEEFATIIKTIGAGFGQNFDIEDSRYGKVIIMTDADDDGAHIQTLLLTFFYHFMRPLITSGKLYVACPPLYRVSKEVNHKLNYRYAWDDVDLDKAKKEIGAGYHVSRYKGLGEMDASQLWESTMDPKTRQLLKVTIEDPLLAEQNVAILMGKDSSERRKWVEEHVDFNEVDKFMEEVK